MQYEIVGDEVEHQICELSDKFGTQLAQVVLRSRSFHDGTSFVYRNKTEESTMCWLCSWHLVTQSENPNKKVYFNKAYQALTKDDLENLALSRWLDEQSDFISLPCAQLVILLSVAIFLIWTLVTAGPNNTGVGVYVDHFNSKIDKDFNSCLINTWGPTLW